MNKEYFTLWILPTGKVFDLLQGKIISLAARYRTDIFEPHVTLLGGFWEFESDVIARATALAQSLRSYPLTLNQIGSSELFFKAIFLSCDLTKESIAAHIRARTVFGVHSGSPYAPHLSLLYGKLSEAERRAAENDLDLSLPISFEAVDLRLYRTPNDDPRQKKELAKFTLAHA